MIKATEALNKTIFSAKQRFILATAEDLFDYAIRKAASDGQLVICVERYTTTRANHDYDIVDLKSSPYFPERTQYRFETASYNYNNILHELIGSLTLLYLFQKSMKEQHGYDTNVSVRREGCQQWVTLTIAWGDADVMEKEKERVKALESQKQELLRECESLGGRFSNLVEKTREFCPQV